MQCSSPEIAARRLKELRFPEIFQKIVLGRHRDLADGFDTYFEAPLEFYDQLADYPEDVPFADHIVPLLERNCDFFVCYVPKPHDIYIEHSIEWAVDDYRIVARTLEEFLDHQIKELCDYGAEDDQILGFGKILGHPDPQRILDLLS